MSPAAGAFWAALAIGHGLAYASLWTSTALWVRWLESRCIVKVSWILLTDLGYVSGSSLGHLYLGRRTCPMVLCCGPDFSRERVGEMQIPGLDFLTFI